jgi:hypothetical protein
MIVRNLATARLVDSMRPVVAKDVGSGYGIFDYSEGPIGFGWPLVATSRTSSSCSIAMLDSGGHLLSRSRVSDWPQWDSVFDVADSGNQPMYETHNIASSHTSNKVCITWVRTDTSPMPGYYRTSSDGGVSWDSVQQLQWPAAYGGDTLTSFHVSSLYPFYDDDDHLNILAAVHPIVHDTGFIMPAGIWHCCPDTTGGWHLLCRAGCAPEHLGAPVGYNAAYADRPSIGEGNDGRLYVAWEQFDSSNVEPQTSLLRAGIWVSSSRDNGTSWTPGLLVTARNTFSHRFPCIVDRMVIGTSEDTVCVLYLMDSVAGFFLQGQGPATPNPVICQFIPGPPSGVKESSKPQATSLKPMATIVRGVLLLPKATSRESQASSLLDVSGRKVVALKPGANDVSHLSPGVYFVRQASGVERAASSITKVVLTD